MLGWRDDGFCFERGKHAFGIHCNKDLLLRLQVILIRQNRELSRPFYFAGLTRPSLDNFLQEESEFP